MNKVILDQMSAKNGLSVITTQKRNGTPKTYVRHVVFPKWFRGVAVVAALITYTSLFLKQPLKLRFSVLHIRFRVSLPCDPPKHPTEVRPLFVADKLRRRLATLVVRAGVVVGTYYDENSEAPL